jgi:hypothetical protein
MEKDRIGDAEDASTLTQLMPAEVYRVLCGEYTGPSPARAIAAYHAMVTGQEMPGPAETWPPNQV